MNSCDFIAGLVIGLLCGIAVFGIALGRTNMDMVEGYYINKELCEAELPRNKQCVMTFVEE